MRLPKQPRVYDPKGGGPPKHGPEFRFAKPGTWPRLTHRSAWLDHDGELPLVEGTLIRLKAEHHPEDPYP